jgi:hypothetical protein
VPDFELKLKWRETRDDVANDFSAFDTRYTRHMIVAMLTQRAKLECSSKRPGSKQRRPHLTTTLRQKKTLDRKGLDAFPHTRRAKFPRE